MNVAILIDNSMELNMPHPGRVFKEAETLVNNGYEVTVFCKKGNENIPLKEIYKGVRIIRCFDYYLGTTELIHNYIISHIQLFNTINEKFHVYHCHDTNTLPIGYILSRRDKAKLIFEAHEYFLDQICREWYGADVLIYLGKPIIKNMEYTIPNKLFDYLFSCRPMIVSDLYSIKSIVQKYNIGINVDIHNIDIESIGREINSFINNEKLLAGISKNMMKIRDLYTWENEEVKLLSLYNELFKR
ncbi:glycosyltransferase [uncultured Clostridium sp.]|uniref:glycosyltransferase n=1 Tax=uncultured Clostridium sp. TaxID=59620 RepID=UPI0025CBEB74|nr:glycosyltransferase [uncultured Clostridium sp.]